MAGNIIKQIKAGKPGEEKIYDIEAKTLTGLTASTAELNLLKGMTTNVKSAIDAKVTGPSVATVDGIAIFGTNGNTLKNSGTTIAGLTRTATTGTPGLMSASDKQKLDNIEQGANKYIHPNSGVKAGTYKSVTVDTHGHVTVGTNPTTLAGYGITDAKISGNTITLGTETVDLPAVGEYVRATDAGLITETVPQNFEGHVIGDFVLKQNVVDSLTSSNINLPLSANQGRVLKSNIDILTQNINGKLSKTGGTLTGSLTAQSNINYTARQVHNIILSPSEPTSSDGANGDIWLVYEV